MVTQRALIVFYSYANEDMELRELLEKHLALMRRQGIVDEWHDRKIDAGTEWADQISDQLERADVILLLISANFLASDYCFETEMKRALARHEAGAARVVPVIVSPCDWQSAPFGKLQALPRDAKPITTWKDKDEAFADIALSLRAIATGEAAPTPITPPVEPVLPDGGASLEGRVFYGVVAAVAFVCLLIIFGLIIWQLPQMRQYGSESITFFSYVGAGLVSAVFLFGIMRSYGTFRGQGFGTAFELGGPAALAALVMSLGLFVEYKMRPRDFAFSVYFHIGQQRSERLHADGKLILDLDLPTEVFIHDGFASPQRIPAKWNGRHVGFSVEIEGYRLVNADETLLLAPDQKLYIAMEPTGDPIPPSTSQVRQSTDELIALLKKRADQIVLVMEEEKRQAVNSHGGQIFNREEFLEELDATQRLFLDLHHRHILAIQAGQFALAHDLVADIHHLLWVRNRDIFWGAEANPLGQYLVNFPRPATYVVDYPGARPANLADADAERVAAIWKESPAVTNEFELNEKLALERMKEFGDRLKKIEKEIENARVAMNEESENEVPSVLSRAQQFSFLTESLSSGNASVRSAAAEHLGRMGADAEPAIPALVAALRRGESEGTEAIARALARIGPAATPSLIKAVGDENNTVAYFAADALYQLGPEARDAVPALVESLRMKRTNRDISFVFRDAREKASEALGTICGDEVKPLISALKDEDHEMRGFAAQALGMTRTGSKPVVGALTELLTDEEVFVRISAAGALGQIGPRASGAVPALTVALRDNDARLRAAAAQAVGHIVKHDAKGVTALVTALRDNSTEVRMKSAEALGSIGPQARQAVPALIEALADDESDVVKQAAISLGKIGPDATVSVPALLKLAADGGRWVAPAAVEALGHIGSADAIPALIDALNDYDVSFEAERALVSIGPAAVPALIEALRDEQSDPAQLAEVLGNIGREAQDAVPALIEALEKSEGYSASRIIRAVGKIGPGAKGGIAALIEALTDMDSEVRKAAAEALGEIGDDMEQVARSLRDLLQDQDEQVRAAAAHAILKLDVEALKKIGSETK